MSIRDFSAHLGVAERTVSKWEAGQDGVCPRPEMQAALDTALSKANEEVRDRFTAADHGKGPLPSVGAAQPGLCAIVRQPAPQPPDALAGLTAVYPSRSQLSARLPPDQLLDGARVIRALGLSLNLLCQGYADRRWHTLLAEGARVQCLFLDPDGSAMRAREMEEGFPTGQLAALTKLNIETLLRIRDRLPDSARDNIDLATYDETLRFNVVLVDDLCVAQPYLTDRRGVDSPAFVISRDPAGTGLYPVFEQVFETHWQRRQPL